MRYIEIARGKVKWNGLSEILQLAKWYSTLAKWSTVSKVV